MTNRPVLHSDQFEQVLFSLLCGIVGTIPQNIPEMYSHNSVYLLTISYGYNLSYIMFLLQLRVLRSLKKRPYIFYLPQHCLYFLPLKQGHGSLRPGLKLEIDGRNRRNSLAGCLCFSASAMAVI